MAFHSQGGPPPDSDDGARGYLGVFRYSRRAIQLVWTTSRGLSAALGVLTLLAGVLPAAVAFVGALIIDAVVAAARLAQESGQPSLGGIFLLVGIEGLAVAALAGAQRGISRHLHLSYFIFHVSSFFYL